MIEGHKGSVSLAVLLACTGLSAQSEYADAKKSFERAFLAAVRGRDPEGLVAARALIAKLDPDIQARARFGVGVRLAEMLLVQGDLKRAGAECLAVRAQAIEDEVYWGSLRPLVLVILWQALPEHSKLDVFDADERAYLRSEQPLSDAAHMRHPIELILTDLDEDEGDFHGALQRVRSLAEKLSAEGVKTSDPWRQKVVLRLFWHHYLVRDYDTAKLYLSDLPSKISLWPRALIALRQRDYVTAEKAARRLAKRDRGSRHLLADVLEEVGRFDEAEAVYQTLLSEGDPVQLAFAQRGLGDCILGRWLRDAETVDAASLALAGRYYQQALSVFASGETTQMLIEQSEATRQLARVFEARGELQRAHELYIEALDGAERGRHKVGVDVFGVSWFGKTGKHKYLSSVDGLLRTASAVGADELDLMLVLERGKARTLLDWIDHPPHIDDRSRVRAAVRAMASSSDPEAARRLASLRGVREPGLSSQQGGDGRAGIVSRAELEEVLKRSKGTLFLSYWLGSEQAWLVWRGSGEGGVILLGRADRARLLLRAAATLVRSPESNPGPALAGAAEFFVPAELHARVKSTGRLVFCPDAELGLLPFEALPVAERVLGISHAVERAPSLSVRQRLAARRSTSDRVIVIDSIDDSAAASLGLDPLRFSLQEGDLVTAAYAEVTRLQGAAADFEGLRLQLQRGAFDLVHLNAHAHATQIPTSSVLVLQDGPVSIASLADLPVKGALVVLSACSSAAGEMRGGEGELGLLGWPLASGARGAVAALWAVNQQATADLMGQFHHYRSKGMGEASAMRSAREALAATDNYAHPYYWAGFGVYASNQPEAADWTWRLGLGIGAVLLLCGAGYGLRRRAKPVNKLP